MKPLYYSIKYLVLLFVLVLLSTQAKAAGKVVKGNAGSAFSVESFGAFDEPWAMCFLPNSNLLVTEKKGNLILFNLDDRSRNAVQGVPKVAYGGQGGLGDVIVHPQFENNHWIYLSYAEQDTSGKKGA